MKRTTMVRGGLVWLCGWMALAAAGVATARPVTEVLETILAAERAKALHEVRQAATLLERVKAEAAARTAALDAESTTAREELAALQKDLMAQLTRDDPAGLKVLRVRLAARQAAVNAAEGEKALLLKAVEDAERDQEAWKKRAATLELAVRIDMKTMLAGPADIEDRERRVDAALKEIESQAGQVRKYIARRAAAVSDLAVLRQRVADAEDVLAASASPELRAAAEQHAGELRRLAGQAAEWVRLNKRLEDNSRRYLAFARTEYLVSRRYADALAHKADVRRAGDLQASAEAADAQLAVLKAAVAPLQQRVAGELATASARNDQALKTLGEARTAQDQARGHAAYAAAQVLKSRWEAEADCLKEFVALQKAGTAFAHELADRARGVAEDRTIFDINQEEHQLRESLVTSEQYVRTLAQTVEKLDGLVGDARRSLGLSTNDIEALAGPLADLVRDYDPAHPPAAGLVADQLAALQARFSAAGGDGDGDERRLVGATLAARLAQRELLQARRAISVRWLENSQAAIRTLERLAGTTLWQQHDPRLNDMACLDTAALAGGVASDASYAWDCIHLALGDTAVPGRRALLKGLVLVLVLAGLGWGLGKLMPAGNGLLGGVGPWLASVLPVAGAAWLTLRVGPANQAFHVVGLLLGGLCAWLTLRSVLRAGTADHGAPAGDTLAGGAYRAIIAIAAWTAVLWPLHRLAALAPNAWNAQAVLVRVGLFGVSIALFRLVLHPTLAGRLLSRRSEHRGLRWLGASVAMACIAAGALAALPYLAGLDNLGSTVLHTVEASFAMLAAALIGTAVTGWTMRRGVLQQHVRTGWIRTIQAVIAMAAGGGVLWIWWQLLNRVVLAPNAPPLVQDMVSVLRSAVGTMLCVWHKELTAGMTVSSLARGILVFALSFWVSRAVRRHFLERVLARTPMDEMTRVTFATILGYVVILLGFLVGLNVAGSSLQNLALLAGAITVGLGFGLQNVINNFVSSLLIHFGRTIRAGDYIDVGGTRGTVKEIGLRNTMIVTDDGITVLVPNGSFVSGNIVNWTNPSRRVRLHVPFVVARQADLTAVTEAAIAMAASHALVIRQPAPLVEVRSVTAAQVSLELLAWTEKPERLTTIVGELNLALDRVLRERGFAA